MAVRPILTDTDFRLRLKSVEANLLEAGLFDLIQDMIDTLHQAGGIGLAAPQIGVHKRVIIVAWPEWPRPEIMVNPQITWHSSVMAHERDPFLQVREACLSVPGRHYEVNRWAEIELKYYEPNVGANATTKLSGMPSIIAQHEIDHLDGVLISDIGK